MKAAVGLSVALVCAAILLPGAGGAPVLAPLRAHQEPRGIGQLVVPGDRIQLAYGLDSSVKGVTGVVYVRNDLAVRFRQLPLRRLRAVVPQSLIRGHRLLYYAVIRAGRRSVRVPASGTTTAWVLRHPILVPLRTHRFGRTASGRVVAGVEPGQVAWQTEGDAFGPETFLVSRDGSIWLDDSLNDRVLVLRGRTVARTISLPKGATDGDLALGPKGGLYVTGGVGKGLAHHRVLYRLDASGDVLWQTRLAANGGSSGTFQIGANSPLRFGPDGTLYLLNGMPGLPGGEPGWMPVATRAGRPLAEAAQRAGTKWPFQPAPGGLRLVAEVYTPREDGPPREARYALVGRSGAVRRAWRVTSATDINFDYFTPTFVGSDLVVSLDVTKQTSSRFRWEYVLLQLGPHGVRARLSLERSVYGDNLLTDLRVGPDRRLYQLASSPTTGVAIERYSLAPRG
jgi:hypothetical protein